VSLANFVSRGNATSRQEMTRSVARRESKSSTLAEIGKRLGRKALRDVASVAKPDTIFASYLKRIAQKFDGSKEKPDPDVEALPRCTHECPGGL
jgi:hypothetical protein